MNEEKINVKFIEEPRGNPHFSSWYSGEVDHIDTYALFNGEKYHIRGRAVGSVVSEFDIERGIEEIEELKRHFIKSRGKWICAYCPSGMLGQNPNWADPFEFLDFVRKNEYTFNEFLGISEHKDHWEFHGNLTEISYAFSFRIFDKDIIERIKKDLKTLAA
jgi:hypothetical protein